jgi:hypothetical protein
MNVSYGRNTDGGFVDVGTNARSSFPVDKGYLSDRLHPIDPHLPISLNVGVTNSEAFISGAVEKSMTDLPWSRSSLASQIRPKSTSGWPIWRIFFLLPVRGLSGVIALPEWMPTFFTFYRLEDISISKPFIVSVAQLLFSASWEHNIVAYINRMTRIVKGEDGEDLTLFCMHLAFGAWIFAMIADICSVGAAVVLSDLSKHSFFCVFRSSYHPGASRPAIVQTSGGSLVLLFLRLRNTRQ